MHFLLVLTGFELRISAQIFTLESPFEPKSHSKRCGCHLQQAIKKLNMSCNCKMCTPEKNEAVRRIEKKKKTMPSRLKKVAEKRTCNAASLFIMIP